MRRRETQSGGEGERHSREEKKRDIVGRRRGTQSGEGGGHCREKEVDTVGRRQETQSGEGVGHSQEKERDTFRRRRGT